MITVWLLMDSKGNSITTDNERQKDNLLAVGWDLISVGARNERSVLDELIDGPTKH